MCLCPGTAGGADSARRSPERPAIGWILRWPIIIHTKIGGKREKGRGRKAMHKNDRKEGKGNTNKFKVF